MNYQNIYISLIIKRQLNVLVKTIDNKGEIEIHHIVPKCCGGTNKKDNLIALTTREHYIAHILLTKIYKNTDNYGKLCLSVQRMMGANYTDDRKHFKFNSKLYTSFRKTYGNYIGKITSIHQSGKGNSQYGTMWIKNPRTKECKKILKTDNIPIGWVRGRYQKPNTQEQINKWRNNAKGYKWITNGIIEKQVRVGMEIPDGFTYGKLKHKISQDD